MIRKAFVILTSCLTIPLFSQKQAFTSFLADSAMDHAQVSFCLIDADSGNTVFEYNSRTSLIPASVMKLITASSAIELLGPDHIFKTSIGYTGKISKFLKILDGDIVIRGGGDPSLGSENFAEHYAGFTDRWIDAVRSLKIKKIKGGVITDDSYFDYLPVPAKWLWEDAGNYYGAGAYGLSIFDNTYKIHLSIAPDSSSLLIKGITPSECRFEFSNWLVAAGTEDKGYVFAAPYSTNGWLAGSLPSNLKDFVLKASITDPPFIMSKLIDQKLRDSGIRVSAFPATTRLMQGPVVKSVTIIDSVSSPPLSKIIEVLNHESINLYAEHLVKELGKVYNDNGSTEKGVRRIYEFLSMAGIETEGLFIEDGSGLSPLNAVSSEGIAALLLFMKTHGKHFSEFYASLPDAGKEGTLKNHFTDPVFESRMKAKSGSMTRVRSYAGYLRTLSGNELIFCIIVNNFSGASQPVISHIEEILKETIQTN
jgi:D-alanyl-D-alanine carboxypeptidase/D-alanyl-D-alanine-endopeptidase (penicillin-binding protein 4)